MIGQSCQHPHPHCDIEITKEGQAAAVVCVSVCMQGVPTVTHAVICHDEKNTDSSRKKFKLVVEGDNLQGVMTTLG